jgi:hypothetical protein
MDRNSTLIKSGATIEYNDINYHDSQINSQNSTNVTTFELNELDLNQKKGSFQNFVEEYQNANLTTSTTWNKERQRYLKEMANKRLVVLKEINQFDFNVN